MEVKILYDKKNRDYFVKITDSSGRLPSFSRMNPRQKKQFLAEYPEFEDYAGGTVPDEKKDNLNSCVERYNKERERVQWLLVQGGRVRPVYGENNLRTLERNSTGFVDMGYVGSEAENEILAFIAEKSMSTYIVYKCNVCGGHGYCENSNNVRCCHCGEIIRAEQIIWRSNAPDARIRAAEKCLDLGGNRRETVFASATVFYYKSKAYATFESDFKMLHIALYCNGATDRVFTIKDGAVDGFNAGYLNYIKETGKNYNKAKEISDKKSKIINEIKYENYSADEAFYWYFNEYALTGGKKLVYREGDVVKKTFESPGDYVRDFCAAEDDGKKLLRLFNSLTCRYFFEEYNDLPSELSRMIYKFSGQFVYVKPDGNIEKFGTDFIDNLSMPDSKVEEKIMFISDIRSNDKFWQSVKKEFDDANDFYFAEENEDGYAKLCFYKFAITGKRVLEYYGLKIANDETGLEYIKDIIVRAYLGDSAAQVEFEEFRNMLHKTSLAEKLNIYDAEIVGNDGTTRQFFNIKSLIKKDDVVPSVGAYLFCLDRIDKNTQIVYNGQRNTLKKHIYGIIAQSEDLHDELTKFISSDDVATMVSTVLADRRSEIDAESENSFNKIKSTLEKLDKDLSEKIFELTEKNVKRESAVNDRAKASENTVADVKDEREPSQQPVTETRAETNEKRKKGGKRNEWA